MTSIRISDIEIWKGKPLSYWDSIYVELDFAYRKIVGRQNLWEDIHTYPPYELRCGGQNVGVPDATAG